MKIVKKPDFYHVFKMRTDFKVNDLPNCCFKDFERSIISVVTTYFDNWYLNNWVFFSNLGPLKIWLLQCYVVLCIHDFDAICISCSI